MNPVTFSDLALAGSIQQALQTEGYTNPTPIQAEAIPHLLDGRDLMGCAQTGTGKTAAFALPVLQQFEMDRRPAVSGAPRALVLSPTRELADQIGSSFKVYGQNVQYRQAVVYGGVNQHNQVRAMKRGVHLLVATPGRLLDLMGQGHIRLDKLELFILDEADRMLDMGFLPDLRRIIADLPSERQSMFFTATLRTQIAELANGLLQNPVRVHISPKTVTVDRIEQKVLFVPQPKKQEVLELILMQPKVERTLVFTRTKHGADRVAKHLSRLGLRTDVIHGNKSQGYRTRALNNFRTGFVRVLVATDVASRGIDVDDISHVINFDLPDEPENYVHRIGRTGRAGAGGVALSFCDGSERSKLRAIERAIGQTIATQPGHEGDSSPRRDARPARPEKKPFYRGSRQQSDERGGRGKYRGAKQSRRKGSKRQKARA